MQTKIINPHYVSQNDVILFRGRSRTSALRYLRERGWMRDFKRGKNGVRIGEILCEPEPEKTPSTVASGYESCTNGG